MRKPNNYENTVTEPKKLPAGGYVCQILACEETKSKAGADMLKVAFEIAEGEYKGFFAELWQNKKMAAFPDEAKYPREGTDYILTSDADGNCSRKFKGFCTALEDSGATVWVRNELADLEGARVGVIFRREETEYNGRSWWQTIPMSYRSVDTIREGKYKVPEDKPLPAPAYPQYQQPAAPQGFTAVTEDIPF